MRIAIQGQPGSFHHEAAEILSGPETLDLSCQKTFADVFNAVEGGEVEYGLTAIENNLHGSINAVYRLLDKRNVWVVKDIRRQIVQNLIGCTGLQDIAVYGQGEKVRVLSHPVALAQVENWLDSNLPEAERIERDDTASSVSEVVDGKDPNVLAVAGYFAARMYGGEVIVPEIQDEENNYTRFIMFRKERVEILDPTHASLILNVDHTPGALVRALNIFDDHGINLTKLDSHPLATDQQHYQFYLDYELNDSNGIILRKLEAMGYGVKLLGFYKRTEE